jgi:hypothetical protein
MTSEIDYFIIIWAIGDRHRIIPPAGCEQRSGSEKGRT